MKKAFTMIELIFTIVIIGILAAVAIPKLAATRDDAKVSKRANEVMNVANEIASFAVSQGTNNINIANVSNAANSMIDRKVATLQNNGTRLNIKMNTVSDCLKLEIIKVNLDINLTITHGNTGNNELCQALQKVIDTTPYEVSIGGSRISI